jgi:hypothetical protein
MGKTQKIALVLILALTGLTAFTFSKKNGVPLKPVDITTPTPVAPKESTVNYKGRDGVDALTLLKEKSKVEQDNSGMVSSIDGRKAETKDRQYWAFYINGKPASVGPASYKTADSDIIEWKVEKY